MKFHLAIFGLFIMLNYGNAQELRCQVSVSAEKIQRSDREIFQKMQTALYEFMNTRIWTNHVYTQNERIECALLLNLDQESGGVFKGTLQIQSSRPVFNSGYNTVMMNYKDNDIEFTYNQFEQLEFDPNTFSSNLTSIFAFYAYLIIGLDYDSFSPEGGTEFFSKAETIVSNAQNTKESGWKAFESNDQNNRYWIVNNLLNDKYRDIRQFNYDYHRLGLDIIADKTTEGRAAMATSITHLQDHYRKKPDPFLNLLRMTLDAKNQEFMDAFMESPMDEKTRIVRILSEIHPSKASEYSKLKTN